MRNLTRLYIQFLTVLALLTFGATSAWAYWTTDRDGNAQADNASIKGYVSKSGSTYYVLDDATERSISLKATGGHVEYNYNINGPAATLTFQAKRTKLSAGNLKVAQRIIGGGWSDKYDNNPGTSYEGSGDISLDEKAVELSFYNEWGNGTRYFKDVKVTMASYCNPETASVAFGSNTYLSSENKTFKVYWSNVGTQTISKSGDTDRFTVSVASVPSKAGYYGNTVVTIMYKRDVVGSHSMTLTIKGQTVTVTGTTTQATPNITSCATASEIAYNTLISTSTLTPGTAVHPTKGTAIDGTWTWQTPTLTADCRETYTVVFTPDAKYGGGYSTQTCEISIPITKLDQTITWDLTPGVEYATGALMDATASSGLTVTYSSNHPEWGYINENNRLVVVEPNQTIVITAHQAGDCNWNAASDVTKTVITLRAHEYQYDGVSAEDITYGDLLGASTLSGNVYLEGVRIDGTLSWVDPTIMPVAGTANHMVLFTPDNTAAYSPVYFEVPVTVAKADPVVTWNIGTILREEVRYDNFVVSSNKEQPFSISVSNTTLLNVSGTTLRTGSVENKVTGLTITLTQPESDNYNYKTDNITVAIYPKAGVCLPFDPITEDQYNHAKVAQDGSVAWCNANEDGHQDDYIWFFDVTYTQRQGIALGSWEAGLEGLSVASIIALIKNGKFDYSPKSVDLFFSGIPDRISFNVETQVVTSTPPDASWNATQKNWYLYESGDGENFTLIKSFNSDSESSVDLALNENTRYVRITYAGNFTGFVENLRITQKKYLREKNNKSELVFGTEANPLQQPQVLTLSYSSLGLCGGTDDNITVTSNNPAFYVDETTITENVGIELKGEHVVRVRCNDVNQTGKLTFRSNDGTELKIDVRSTNPYITTAATSIFETGTEYASVSTPYRAQRTHDFSACFDGAQAKFDYLYIYGVSESSAADRQWIYDASKGYKVPAVSTSNVHTPCFIYKKDGARYTHVSTFDAATTTLNVADGDTRVLVGYRPVGPAETAIQVNGASAEIYLNNTEIIATGAPLAVNATSAVHANGTNILSSTSNAAVQLSRTTTLSIEDTWTGATSAILALRPAVSYPSIDLGSASGRVDINGTQLELHNATHMAIAHMDGTTEKYDGEVHINDGSVGGEEILGMPKATFIDGGTFNDGTVEAYTVKGMPKRPRNSNGDMLSRHTMTPAALLSGYPLYGQAHLTLDGSAKVNPMLMDEEVWIFTGDAGPSSDEADSWNKEGVPGKDDDVLINAPMVIAGEEMKVKSLTINWVGSPEPAVTVAYNGGLTVGEGGIDGMKVVNMVNNFVLKADNDPSSATKGQTGFLRVHPESAEPMPKATVELFTTAYFDMSVTDYNYEGEWQYVGSPLVAGVSAKDVFKKNMIYSWIDSIGDWKNNKASLELNPFTGYAITQYRNPDGLLIKQEGTLAANEAVDVPLTYYSTAKEKGINVLANSFTAPIDLTLLEETDFSEGADATIHLFNTGSEKNIADLEGQELDVKARGQYISIPVKNVTKLASEYAGFPKVLPAMQGFYVTTTKKGTLTLDYRKLVWEADYSDNPNTALHAKLHNSNQNNADGNLRVSIETEDKQDNVYLLESDEYSAEYENGYDAHKMMSGDFNIFTIANEDKLSVDATNSLVGTRIGVRTGEEMIYIMSFSHLRSEEELSLIDNETNQKIDIYEGTHYPFYAAPNSEITDRFQIVARNDAPSITTGIDGVTNETKAYKFIKDGQMYILKNGVLYNAMGGIVR